MKISNKKLKSWKIMALVVTEYSDYYADEILSKVIEKVSEKEDVTDNYIFISLKNTYLNMLKSEEVQHRKKLSLIGTTYYDELNDVAPDIEEIEEIDRVKQNRLNAISEAYTEVLNTFEQQLFYIHFTKGISQRQISRDTGINVMVINKKINKIKTKIKEYYAKNN